MHLFIMMKKVSSESFRCVDVMQTISFCTPTAFPTLNKLLQTSTKPQTALQAKRPFQKPPVAEVRRYFRQHKGCL
jgi:hypothetical protein